MLQITTRRFIPKNILKGLHHSAQRCRDAVEATLGSGTQNEINSEGVASHRGGHDATTLWLMFFWILTQGGRSAPTLG
jgi:hypothetical protein